MGKTKHKHKIEDEFDDGVVSKRPTNRHKEKRLDRALRTRNIDELMKLDDEGIDPIDIEDEIWDDEILSDEEVDKFMGR